MRKLLALWLTLLIGVAQAQTILPGSGSSGATASPINMGYITGRWYVSPISYATNTGVALTAGNDYCQPYIVSPPGGTFKAEAVYITGADATPNYISLAIYNNGANGFPSTIVDSIGTTGITTASGTPVSGSLANTTDILAAGAYWVCYATNSITATVASLSLTYGSGIIGASTLTQAFGNSSAGVSGVNCTAGASNCGPTWANGSGSSYTWPPTLAGATWAVNANSKSPAIALQAN